MITAVAGRPVRTEAEWDAVLAGARPGERLAVTLWSRGATRVTSVSVVADPGLTLVDLANINRVQRDFRARWLGSGVEP